MQRNHLTPTHEHHRVLALGPPKPKESMLPDISICFESRRDIGDDMHTIGSEDLRMLSQCMFIKVVNKELKVSMISSIF